MWTSRQRPLQPTPPLDEMRANLPERVQRQRHAERAWWLVFEEKCQRRSQVVVLCLQPSQPHGLLRTREVWFSIDGELEEECGMPFSHPDGLARLLQAVL